MTALNSDRSPKGEFLPGTINAEQEAAIRAIDGPSIVIAGPGSGKTQTLAAKALHIRSCYPEGRILCVTHTRKAAEEMLGRIARQERSNSITISTIHSLCYGILKTSRRQSLKILSHYDHAAIVRLAARTVGIESDVREIAQSISQTKLGMLDHDRERGKLVCEYERLKGQRLDYDDLLLLALDTLQSADNSSQQPSHILVDEAQDLDPVQTALIGRLAGDSHNVTFFLDHNQAIFSFKGACYDQIERLAEIYPDTRKFYLVRNHRSSGKILDAANRLIQRNGSDNYSIPTRHAGVTPIWVAVGNEIEEAQLAARIVEELIYERFEPREILLLYRVNHYRAELESELIDNEIPFSVLKNTSVLLKESLLLPLCLQAWRPDDAWEEILLRHYLGRRHADEIGSLAKERRLSAFETALERAIHDAVIDRGLALLFDDLRKVQRCRNKPPLTVANVASAIIEKRGFITDNRETKGLCRLMGRYRNLGEIVEQIEWLRYLNDIPREKRVHLSTIHRAKGLEHRAVILLGCVEGILPFQVKDEANIPEERRLAYVAVTRAKDFFIAIAPKTLYGEPTEPSRFIREMGLQECESVKETR